MFGTWLSGRSAPQQVAFEKAAAAAAVNVGRVPAERKNTTCHAAPRPTPPHLMVWATEWERKTASEASAQHARLHSRRKRESKNNCFHFPRPPRSPDVVSVAFTGRKRSHFNHKSNECVKKKQQKNGHWQRRRELQRLCKNTEGGLIFRPPERWRACGGAGAA